MASPMVRLEVRCPCGARFPPPETRPGGVFPCPVCRKTLAMASPVAAGARPRLPEGTGGKASSDRRDLQGGGNDRLPASSRKVADLGKSRNDKWHLQRSGENVGPLPYLQLWHLAVGGELCQEDLVRLEGQSEWVKAGSVPGLFYRPPGGARGEERGARDAGSRPAPLAQSALPRTPRPSPLARDASSPAPAAVDDPAPPRRKKRFWFFGLALAALLGIGALNYGHALVASLGAQREPEALVLTESRSRKVICTGRVETIKGEVDVSAQIGGQLAEVRVREGERVEQGAILAVIDSTRQAAEVAVAERDALLAKARLDRLIAGNGAEEVAQALASVHAAEADLANEKQMLERAERLYRSRAVSREELDQRTYRVEQLGHQVESLRKRHEAVRRGSLKEEIEVARTEVKLSESRLARTRVEYDYRLVRAPMAGTVLKLYRERGDSVSLREPTPILRLANTQDLRVRLEIDETNVRLIRPGLEAVLEVAGTPTSAGRVRVETIVPLFGPKRLFNPDTSPQQDARTLTVLCKIRQAGLPLYPGQRVTARFDLGDAAPSPTASAHAPDGDAGAQPR